MSPTASRSRLSMTSLESVARLRRRSSSARRDGGRIQIDLHSGSALRTCCAPCQSISSTTSWRRRIWGGYRVHSNEATTDSAKQDAQVTTKRAAEEVRRVPRREIGAYAAVTVRCTTLESSRLLGREALFPQLRNQRQQRLR